MLGEARQILPVLTMNQALLNHENFDVFVIDEADQCLLEKGVSTSDNLQSFVGFWDILLKRTILLTATAGESLCDILFDLFGHKSDKFLSFDTVLRSSDQQACRAHIEYELVQDEKAYWQKVQ